MAVVCIETRTDRMRNLLKSFGRERSQPGDAGHQEQPSHASQVPPHPQSAGAVRDDDEDFRLALQLSTADEERVRGGTSRPARPLRAAPTARPLEPTDSDEAIARHLQEQLDLEAAATAPPRGPAGRLPPPHPLHAAPQLPLAQPTPSAPCWQPPTPSSPWAASPRAPHPPAGPLDNGGMHLPSLPADPNVCGGCGKPVHWLAVVPTALGRRWHPACLRCAHCSARIQVRTCACQSSSLAVAVSRPCMCAACDAHCVMPGCAQVFKPESYPASCRLECQALMWEWDTRVPWYEVSVLIR